MRKIIAGALHNEKLCEFGLTTKVMKLNKRTTISYICMWYLFYFRYKYVYTNIHGHNTIDQSITGAY